VASAVAQQRFGSRGFPGSRLRLNRWALLAIPPVAFLGCVFAYPLFKIIQLSVTEPSAGLSNYTEFFSNGTYVDVLLRTIATGIAVTAMCLVLGFPYAYAMSRARPAMRTLLTFVLLVPLWTSLLVRTYGWTVLLQDTGIINRALQGIGIIDSPLHIIRTTGGVMIGMSQILLPFMILPLYAVMRGIDPSYMRAARSLGARPAVAFARVYLPMTLPGVAAGSLIVFVWALGFYITPSLLGSPRQTQLSQLIVTEVQQLLNFGAGSAMAVILLVITLVILGLVSRVVRIDKVYGG
jgi:putative spermidine/putrescine transport system permease protein